MQSTSSSKKSVYPILFGLLVAVVTLLTSLPVTAIAAEETRPAPGLYDEGGVLSDADHALIEPRIEQLTSAGAPTVVYIRLHDATVDETIADARELMSFWDVESETGARDGIVMMLNLDTDDPEHGSLAIVAGEAHVEPGTLSESRLDRIRDEMIDLLADGERGEAIALGLERLEERLEEGPPEPGRFESWLAGIAEGPFNILNAIAVLATIAIGFVTWRSWVARPRIENVHEIPTTTAPGELHPAYAGALASGRVNDSQLEATVLELARRGALVIEPDPEEEEKARIRLLDTSIAQTTFEARLLDIFQRQGTDGVVKHTELGKTRNEWGKVRDILKQDLEERGWFDRDITQRRMPFIIAGIAGELLGIALIVAIAISSEPWPVAGAIIVMGVSTVSLVFASILPATTREGEAQAIPWRGYRTGLTNARDSAYGEVDLDSAFPYIVAMSLTPKFQKHLKKANEAGYVPTWLGREDEVANFAGNWYVYWIAMHTAMAPTDASTTSVGTGAATGSGATGGRF